MKHDIIWSDIKSILILVELTTLFRTLSMKSYPFHITLLLGLLVLFTFSCQQEVKVKPKKNEIAFEPIEIDFISVDVPNLEPVVQPQKKETPEQPYQNFSLRYSYAGLGSNMGQLAPVFRVSGTHFTYTLEQNSYMGEQTKSPEDVCEGDLSLETIQSILELVEPIEDSLVYSTNVNIMSGRIHHLSIQHDEVNVTFTLHNASDPIAEKVLNLLNPYISENRRKLRLPNYL